jgi:protease IV
MTREHVMKNIFYGLLALTIAPTVFKIIHKGYDEWISSRVKIGVIPLRKVLTSSNQTIHQLTHFFKDKHIKAILIKMDCPGGAAGTSQAIFGQLKALREEYPEKPVVVFVENLCASGGYYIASAADYIVATPSSFVGSVGVYISVPLIKRLMETIKIDSRITKTGDYKLAVSPFVERTADQEKMIQTLCDDTYQRFVADVRAQRPALNQMADSIWANGKIFTGSQAAQLGLIDETGPLFAAERKIKQLLHIDPREDVLYIKAPTVTPLARLMGADDADDDHGHLSLASCVQELAHAMPAVSSLVQEYFGSGSML